MAKLPGTCTIVNDAHIIYLLFASGAANSVKIYYFYSIFNHAVFHTQANLKYKKRS